MFWRWVRRYLTFVAVATGALFGLLMGGAAVQRSVWHTPELRLAGKS